MLDVIEKLLILQDRDLKIRRTQTELAHIGPQRQSLQAKAAATQSGLEAAKLKVKQIETERKKLELDVQSKKTLIEKYALQQFQTKKNEEYRALAHEIETCKEAIVKIEDQELDFMEQADQAQKRVVAASKEAADLKKVVDGQITELDEREVNLKKQLAELQSNRAELSAAVEEGALNRYERLLKHKGENVVVGIDHGVCGGCHMKLPTQLIVSCQGQTDLVGCTNCGRILYYNRNMDLAVVD